MSDSPVSHADHLVQVVREAQERFGSTDTGDPTQFVESVISLLDAIGLVPGDDEEGELFIHVTDPHAIATRRKQRPLNELYLDTPVRLTRKARKELGRPTQMVKSPLDTKPARNFRAVKSDLDRIVRAKRPLQSNFCRGVARLWVGWGLKTYLRPLLLKHRPLRHWDFVTALTSKRLKPAEHEAIRTMITEQLIPELIRREAWCPTSPPPRKHRLPSRLAWRQTVLLEFWEEWCAYVPVPGELNRDRWDPSGQVGVTAITKRHTGAFLDFVEEALKPYVKPGYLDRRALSEHWRRIRSVW